MILILTNAIVTAYVATGNPCADGHMPQVGITCAVPRNLPLGCRVIIEGHEYVGQDRTAKKFDGRFDLFFAGRAEAIKFGRQKKNVTVITK